MVSLKDSRNPSTGAVTVADVVAPGATAVACNLTIDATVGSGFLGVTPGDSLSSPSSSINWSSPNLILANAGIVKLDASRQVKVFAGGGGSTHFLIDITGYYI